MKKITNPHDRYFRAAMSEPQVAREFFEVYLPPEIKTTMDLNSLELCKESYIDEKLQLQITDLLFSVNFSAQLGYLYLLTEHQSTPEFFMPLRLWKYILSIMEQHIAKSKEKILPIVYPIIYYNGHVSYGYSTDFFDLFGEHKDFAKSILLQPFRLIDLKKIADEELRQYTWVGIMSFVMKHIYARNIISCVEAVIPLLKQVENLGADRYIEKTFSYLLQFGEVSNQKTIVDIFVQELSSRLGEKIMTSADVLREEGMRQGMKQGMAKGLGQGIEQTKRSVATKLLRSGMDPNEIVQITELPLDEVYSIKQKMETTAI